MTIDRKLLEILVCPVTKQPLSALPQARLDALNRLIAQGKLQTAQGEPVAEPLQQALITQNGTTVYRITDNIPVMLEEEGIPCAQIKNW